MGIKLFAKHLMCSIKRRPLQPIILTLVVVLAVTVCALSCQVGTLILDEIKGENNAENGSANITVSVSSVSKSRLLNPKTAKSVLGGNTEVCGLYALPFYYGEYKIFTYGAISDVEEAAKIFDLPTMPLGRRDKRTGICITRAFAKENDVTIGQDLPFTILGKSCTFTVTAIAETPIFGEYEVLIDTVALMSLAEGLSALEDLVEPYGKLFIRLEGDDPDVDSAIAKLTKAFPTEIVASAEKNTWQEENNSTILVWVLILVAFLLTSITLYCCFMVLATQRREENELFYEVGTKAYMLNTLSVAEMFLYWFVGAVIGVAATFPLTDLMIEATGMQYAKANISWSLLGIISAFMLGATELGTMLYIIEEEFRKHRIKKKQIKKQSNKLAYAIIIVLLLITIAFTVGIFHVNVAEKEYPAIVALVALVMLVFCVGKTFFPKLAKRLDAVHHKSVYVQYAIKNATTVRNYKNTAGFISAAIVLVCIASLAGVVAMRSDSHYKTIIKGDLIVAGATATAKEEIAKLEGCAAVHDVYIGEGTISKFTNSFAVIAPDSPDVLTDDYHVSELPEGRTMYVNQTSITNYGFALDSNSVYINGVEYKDVQTVGGITASEHVIILNAKELGLEYNYTVITAKDGYDLNELRKQVFETCNTDYVVIGDVADATAFVSGVMDMFVKSLMLSVVEIFVFATIGLADSIVSVFKSRKEEFDCYMAAGMTKTDIRKMKRSEVALLVAYGLGMAIIVFGYVFFLFYELMLGTSVNIFYVL